jgi:hypothetical protein
MKNPYLKEKSVRVCAVGRDYKPSFSFGNKSRNALYIDKFWEGKSELQADDDTSTSYHLPLLYF